MSGIMKSSLFFAKKVGSYSDGWGEVTAEDRKRITRPRLPAYRITNLAAARAVQATLGICTLLPALNIL